MFSVEIAPSVAYFNSVQENADSTAGYKNLNFGISAGATGKCIWITFGYS